MSVIADFVLPAEAFALAQTFEDVPDITIEVERLATHSREWVMPFLWATGDDLETFERGVQDDPSVDGLVTVDTASGVGLYNVHWSDDVAEIVDTVVDQHGIVLEAYATAGEWHLKLRFLDQAKLDDFRQYFDDHGYSFQLDRLVSESEPKRREFDLTPEQREVLLAALESGYFDVPRETTSTELAAELGISANAVSQRIRRATANLVRNALVVTPYETPNSDE